MAYTLSARLACLLCASALGSAAVFAQQTDDDQLAVASDGPALIILDVDEEELNTETVIDSSDIGAPLSPRGPVTFSAPLLGGDPWVAGRSIEQLIAGSPLHPPLEGLPDELWKDQQCSSCHQWERVNVCEQASFYTQPQNASRMNKPHPYGGSFKANLKLWADAGCP